MPVVRFDVRGLNALVGQELPAQRLAERLPMIGGDLDSLDGDELAIEFFPNRPDLLSVEGVARAARAFFDVKHGMPEYGVEKGDEEVVVESGVAKVRPAIGFARVDGVDLDEARLESLIDLQERLTMGLGRKRKKVAIGIHDAKEVASPYRYTAVGLDEVEFVPLGMTEALTPRRILAEHDKGRLYGGILEGHDKVPLIVDRDGHVLSLPPIINGTRTQLTTSTKDVLVDVTGHEEAAVNGALNIVVCSLSERGGRVRSLTMRRGKKRWTAPSLTPARWTFSRAYAEALLGIELDSDRLEECLGRMAHRLVGVDGDDVTVEVGAWRVDLIHPVDLVEEVAIGFGFDRFQDSLPTRAMFGGQRPSATAAQRARTLFIGHGFTEAVSLTLTNPKDHFEALGAEPTPVVRVSNPATQDHSMLRSWLYPSLLALLRANKHNPLPQSVFEVGIVVPPVKPDEAPHNELRAAAVRIASRAGFSEAKSVAEAFLRDAGIGGRLAPGTVAGLVEGRTAVIESDHGRIGFLGEVAPATLDAFDLEAPAYVIEAVLDPRPAAG